MKRYSQLTREQRFQIYALKKAGLLQCRIADLLGVHKSTTSREFKRNRGKQGYRSKQAHLQAQHRRLSKYCSRIPPNAWKEVEAKLKLYWSPEKIAGWLRGVLPSVMSGSTSLFWLTRKTEATSISIYIVKSSARSAMVSWSVVASFQIICVLRLGWPLSSNAHDLAIGNLTPSSSKDISRQLFRSQSVRLA